MSQALGSHFGMLITQPKSKKIKPALGHLQWDQEELLGEKTVYQKSRETVPLRKEKPQLAHPCSSLRLQITSRSMKRMTAVLGQPSMSLYLYRHYAQYTGLICLFVWVYSVVSKILRKTYCTFCIRRGFAWAHIE